MRATSGYTNALYATLRLPQFRCDIKGLGAESAKEIEEFSLMRAPFSRISPQNPTVSARAPGPPRRYRLMTCRRPRFAASLAASTLAMSLLSAALPASAADYPITPQQRGTAEKVAQAGVPLSELAPNAPDSHNVVPGDTLWGISKIFLKSPWRWPELWGMNLQQIRNPHLIYPGQILYLEKVDGRARLRVGQPMGAGGTVKLSPRVRGEDLGAGAIASIPFNLIQPFLNEAVIFETNELTTAPRIVAAPEGRVMMARGDKAYARGEFADNRNFRIFREPKPLKDPATGEVLGFEAAYVGTADMMRPGSASAGPKGETLEVPATVEITSLRQESMVGDRLAPVPPRDFSSYAPHPPAGGMSGQIASIYGDGMTAGQNQIVALNRGARDGIDRGQVLALWLAGRTVVDRTDETKPNLRLPDERHGMLFVFRVFDRLSYALILSVKEPVKIGDAFTQP
jgi:LysM repeat protein